MSLLNTPTDSGSSMTGSRTNTSIELNELDGIQDDDQTWNAMDLGALGWDGDIHAAESEGSRNASASPMSPERPNLSPSRCPGGYPLLNPRRTTSTG